MKSLPLILLASTLMLSGCYFTAGFSKALPVQQQVICPGNSSVTHYRAVQYDGGCGQNNFDCTRPGYCCPSGLCDSTL